MIECVLLIPNKPQLLLLLPQMHEKNTNEMYAYFKHIYSNNNRISTQYKTITRFISRNIYVVDMNTLFFLLLLLLLLGFFSHSLIVDVLSIKFFDFIVVAANKMCSCVFRKTEKKI